MPSRPLYWCAALSLVSWIVPLSKGGATNPGWPVTFIQTDPHHRGTLLAGTAAAQLFRSRDQGATWRPLPFPPALHGNLHALLIDTRRPDVYLAALSSELPEYSGLFRSFDEGATWQQVNGLKQKQVWALALWAGDTRVIAAGTQEGVFLSSDGGDNWVLAASNSQWPRPVVSLTFDPKNRNTLYAGTPHLAWKTTDGGKNWLRISRGMRDDSDVFAISVDGARRKRLLAGACSGIYSSADGGATWFSLEDAVGGQHRTYVLARPPRRPNVVFAATSGGLMHSTDGGGKWEKVSPEPARSIAFDPVDSRLVFVATDRGVLRSEDGGLHFDTLLPAPGL
jgi:photosystem II stability/assembly factor-like uncharacterized protein